MSSSESAPPDESRGTEVPRSCAPPMEKERLPHSKCGIASFVFVLLAHALFFLWFCYMATSLHGCAAMAHLGHILFGFFAYFLASLVAFILGIVAMYRPYTRKIYAVWGLILSLPPVILATLVIMRWCLLAFIVGL